MNSFENVTSRWQTSHFCKKTNRLVSHVLALSTDACLETTIMKPNVVLSYFGRDLAQRSVAFLSLATLGTR